MRSRTFLLMWRSEIVKIFSRGGGLATLVVAAGVAGLAVMGLYWAVRMGGDATINNQPLDSLVRFDGATAFTWALKARNFFILPLLILWSTGASLAGEIRDRTLREALVRPVPRWSVLLAKLAALASLSACTLLITGALSAVAGAALFGVEGQWGPVSLGYLVSWLSDLGLIALGLAAAVWLRSVAGVVVGVVLFLMADLGIRLVLKLLAFVGLEAAPELARWMPGEALGAWAGFQDGWSVASFTGLGLLFLIALGVALARLQRMDVS